MKKLSHKTLRFISWIGLALVLLTTGLSYWAAIRYQESVESRAHSDSVLDQLRDTELALANSETSQRGFVITGSQAFADKYVRFQAQLEKQFTELHNMVRDNPAQTAVLDEALPIGQRRIELLNVGFELARAGKSQQAIEHVRKGVGAVLMGQLSEIFGRFEMEEHALLRERSARADRDFRLASLGGVVGLLSAFGLLLLVTSILQLEIDRRLVIERDLVKAKESATEASELKSSFLANMSHEIRTPLNGILGMARLLENTTLTDEQKDFVETMKVSSNSLTALINQILDFSKIESGKMQLEEAPFELESLIKSTISVVDYSASSKGIEIVPTIAKDVGNFYMGDSLRLRQVLLNLLNNAIKFSERGTIQVNVSCLRAWDSKITLLFEVSDEGVGLDPAAKDRLFQVFSQGDDSTSRKFGGSGLGLAISKQIVELMDGTIGVESAKGKGSRFFFDVTLTVSKFREAEVSDEGIEMKPRSLGAHILIAEDNRVNQKVAAEMMRLLGCTSRIVVDGQEVLQALREERFDLVLMDGQMPEMDGYEATRQIRAGAVGDETRQIPIIATTANAIKGDIEKCLSSGMNDYVGKPISYDDLAYKVEKWLRRGHDVIDEAAIKRVLALGEDSGPELLRKLVDLFVQDCAEAFATLRRDLENRDIAMLTRTAHVMKSSSANMGALRLRDLFERVEKSKADVDINHLTLMLDSAEREYHLAVIGLKDYLKT